MRHLNRAATTAQDDTAESNRFGQRQPLRVQGRLTWRDGRGMLRFASVVTRNVSETGVFVECQAPTSIPLHRLVHFQVERSGQECQELPESLRRGKVLSAVCRVGAYTSATGTPQGYALRLLIEQAFAHAPAIEESAGAGVGTSPVFAVAN
jgi:hypothetical protein